MAHAREQFDTIQRQVGGRPRTRQSVLANIPPGTDPALIEEILRSRGFDGGGPSAQQRGFEPTRVEEQHESILGGIIEGGVPQAQETTEEVLRSLLGISPQIARQGVALQQELAPQLQELFARLRSADRTADIEDVLRLAPQLQPIRRAGEMPVTGELRDLLLGTTLQELQAGRGLTAEQLQDVTQDIRAGEVSRGIGGGPGSANREAVARALRRDEALQQRLGRAQSVLGQEAAQSPDPFLAILSRPATSVAFGSQALAQPPGFAPALNVSQIGQAQTGRESGQFFNALQGQLALDRRRQLIQFSLTDPFVSQSQRNVFQRSFS